MDCMIFRLSSALRFIEVAANLFLLATLKQPCQHTRWDEEGVSLLKLHSLASISSVSQEDITLLARQDPVLIKGKVVRGWRHEPKHLRRGRDFIFRGYTVQSRKGKVKYQLWHYWVFLKTLTLKSKNARQINSISGKGSLMLNVWYAYGYERSFLS